MATLADLESKITASVPIGYSTYVRSNSEDSLSAQGFDPTTLLVLNLELAELEDTATHRNRFFLNGDGCGNYYFVKGKDPDETVHLWDHDPLGVADMGVELSDYLPTAVQECRIDWPPDDSQLYICRTRQFGESILDPIRLNEWIAAVEATDGIQHVGYREGKNPFTDAVVRFEQPGFSVTSGADVSRAVHWLHGRAILANAPDNWTVAATLAEKLNAHLIGSINR